jgi:threonyl-tRNA synthetase
VIAGDRDGEDGAVSLRYRDGRQDNGVPRADAVARIAEAVEQRVQV